MTYADGRCPKCDKQVEVYWDSCKGNDYAHHSCVLSPKALMYIKAMKRMITLLKEAARNAERTNSAGEKFAKKARKAAAYAKMLVDN